MTQALIGNRHDAWLAHEARRGFSQAERIGSGANRTCYLINGVVYKVDDEYADEMYGSGMELRQAQSLYRRYRNNDGVVGSYVRIPRTSGFRVNGSLIVAMEHIKGKHPGEAPYNREARLELFSLGFRDMHGYNFIVEDSTSYLVPIDLASPRGKQRGEEGRYDEGPDLRVFARNGGWDSLVRVEQDKRDAKRQAKMMRKRKRDNGGVTPIGEHNLGLTGACGIETCHCRCQALQ